MREKLSDLRFTWSVFGAQATELAGISIRPGYQKHDTGTLLVGGFVDRHEPERMTAYTRNPSLLRLLERVSGVEEILLHDNPEEIAETLDHASVGHDGHVYHVGRYGPDGLYGSFDPATRIYSTTALLNQCVLLSDKNNALAVSVPLQGGK
jgi:hypothetical protein